MKSVLIDDRPFNKKLAVIRFNSNFRNWGLPLYNSFARCYWGIKNNKISKILRFK